jgi:hypothetical protein
MYLVLILMQAQPNAEQVQKLATAILAVMPLFILAALAIVITPMWFICKKSGFSPWLSLLNIIPLGGLILLYVLAFSDWKVVPAPQPAWQIPPFPPPPAG